MHPDYVAALEKRVNWCEWGKKKGIESWDVIDQQFSTQHSNTLPSYVHTLETGDTFFMNRQFCELAEHARETIPDDLTFEMSWLQAESGWLSLKKPFGVPTPEQFENDKLIGTIQLHVSAVGWFPVRDPKTGEHKTFFLCFQDFDQYADPDHEMVSSAKHGFGSWSHFTLKDGDRLIDRIRQFEKLAGGHGHYKNNRQNDLKHEMRWVYAAFHLMSQLMSHHSKVMTDRSTRRRAERDKKLVSPFVRVVSLRRLEEAREKAEQAGEVSWQWQWGVRGHWRNQFFSSDGSHRQVFIESYMKGPTDKPVKAPQHNLFVAKR